MVERGGLIRVGDRVRYDGVEHAVVALSGAMVRLVDPFGQASVVALPYLTAAPGFALVEGGGAPRLEPLGLLDGLPVGAVEEARMWERHLVEVETGLPLDAGPDAVPKAEYDPVAHSLTAREKAKAAELSAAGTSTTWRTVQRKRRRYREQGLLGLVDARILRRASPGGRVDERVLAAVEAVVSRQTNASTGTKTRAIRQVKEHLDGEFGDGEVPLPSQATLYRLLDAASAGRHTFGSATTRRSAAGRPRKAFTSTHAARPGEQVQIDATVLDVMALMDDGAVGRPELVAAVDVAMRTICAALLRPGGAKAVDAAALLARMMVPEPMRPEWDQALRMSASRLPYQRLVSVDRRLELAAAKPVIVPETVVIDHGKVFISETFTRAARTLGISVQSRHDRAHQPTRH